MLSFSHKKKEEDAQEKDDTTLEFLPDMREEAQDADGIPKRRGMLFLLALALCVLIASVYMIFSSLHSFRTAEAAYERVRRGAVSTTDDPLAHTQLGAERPEGATLDIDFQEITPAEGVVVGWLHVPAFDISYPVLQTDDNDYYLDHTIDGTPNPNGAVFMEYTNAPDFSYGNTFLYGHNSADGTMFGRLHEFSVSGDYVENEPFFYIYRPNGIVDKYRIYSYYYAENGSRSFVYFPDDSGYDYYVGLTTGLSDKDLDADFSSRGRIVTLATCYGGIGTQYRYLVHGVLTESGRFD